MKKLLLTCLLALMGLLSAVGAEFNYGTYIGKSTFYEVYLLDAESKTVAVSFSNNTADVIIPETISSDGSLNSIDGTYSVVQVNSVNAKNLTIPGTVEIIAPGCFYPSALETITFAKGETALQLYPAFKSNYNEKLKSIEINRDIDGIKYSKDDLYFMPSKTNEGIVLKIGEDVKTLTGPLFSTRPECKLPITKVEYASWANWYNNTVIDCIEGNPYREGATIEAGGYPITTVTIPNNATEIGDYKNMGLKYEGEVFLPSTLKKIGAYAFANQKDLYYVEFPDHLEEIGDHAFDGCETLTFSSFPSSLKTIGEYAFCNCQMVESIEVPEDIESIGKGAFRDMTSLTSANLTSNLTEVADELFAGCSNLYTLYLPVKATRIGDFAFLNTYKLEDVKLPMALEEIGFGAFAAWEEISAANISQTEMAMYKINKEFVDGTSTISTLYFKETGISHLNNIEFPATLKTIGACAFINSTFYNIEFNEGLTTIGNGAFFNNKNITSVIFPESLITIGSRAFEIYKLSMTDGTHVIGNVQILNKVVIPDAVITLGERAFYRPIGEISLGKGITSVGSYSLGVPAVVTFGENVTTVNSDAFVFKCRTSYSQDDYLRLRLIHMNGTKAPTVTANFEVTTSDCDLINVYVPDGLKNRYTVNPRWKIFNIIEEGEAAIQVHVNGAPISEELKLQSGIQPSQVTKMRVTGTLADTDWRLIRENMISLTELDLSAITNTEIPAEALSNMAYLTKLILPAKATSIGNKAFYNNSLMIVSEIPAGVASIGDEAFFNCSSITITELPEALTSIGSKAFSGCSSLRTISAGEKLETIGNGSVYNPKDGSFSNCTSLESVDFSNTNIKRLVFATFYNCGALSNVILPESVTSIGMNTFLNTALENINFPVKLTEIGQSAFEGTKLRTVTLPEGVTNVANTAFKDCTRLVSVHFPGTLKSIGSNLFNGSLRVTGLSCPREEAPEAVTAAFTGMRVKRVTLTIPQQSYRSYLNAPQWGIFADLQNRLVVEIPDNVDATIVNEEEYQQIQLELMVEEIYEEAEEETEPEEAAVRARKANQASLAKGENYSRLFNGAVVASANNPGGICNRVFFNARKGVITKVELDGNDITGQLQDNSIVLSSGHNGTLKVYSENLTSLEDAVVEGVVSSFCTAYDTMGRVVFSGYRAELEGAVAPGVYIVRSGDATEKVLVK